MICISKLAFNYSLPSRLLVRSYALIEALLQCISEKVLQTLIKTYNLQVASHSPPRVIQNHDTGAHFLPIMSIPYYYSIFLQLLI